MDALLALILPFVVLAFLRWLSMQWFPWVMRPLERIARQILRAVWRVVWTNPVRAWGVLNVLWVWILCIAILTTLSSATKRHPDWFGVIGLWLIVGLGYYAIRAIALWRHRPRRLPTRHRWEN